MVRAPAFAEELHEGGLVFPVLDAVPGVATLLVSDTGHAVRYLDGAAIEALGLSASGAFRTAADQLLQELDVQRHEGTDGTWMFTAGGTYEASLMVFDPLWEIQEEELGPLLVGIPARDLCLAAPKADAAAVAALEAAVQDAFDREVPYLLVPHLYERKAGMWSLAGSVQAPNAAHRLRTIRFADREAWLLDPEADAEVLCVAPELLTGAVPRDDEDAFDPHVTQDDLRQALEDRMLAQRPELSTDASGITTLTDRGGDAVELGLYGATLEAALEEDSLVAFPSLDLVLAAQ